MSLVPIDRYAPVTTLARNEWIELVRPAADLASQIANTDFVPKEFRNKPDAITACVLYGAELGLGPMVSLSKIAVIQGRPAPYAELGRALALAAGHEIWVEESNNTRVTVSGKRKGSNHTQSVTWTHDDVKKAGINNQNYSKYPRQMLLARASAELVRAMCPDVLGGIAVFAEEAVDIDDRDTPTITPTTPTTPATATDSPPGTRKRSRAVKAAPEPTEPAHHDVNPTIPDGEHDPTTGDDAGPSEAQTKMAMALFANLGAPDRDERLAKTSAILHREIESWNGVTHDEASRVIDGLQRVDSGEHSFVYSDSGWTVVVNGDELLDGGDDAA